MNPRPRWRRVLGSPLVPGGLLALASIPILIWWSHAEVADTQKRNLDTLILGIVLAALLLLWTTLGSPLPGRLRLAVLGLALLAASLFRVEGMSGDLVPILRLRGTGPSLRNETAAPSTLDRAKDFPRFFGPEADGVVPGVVLDPDWAARPPRVLWRRPVGAAWSAFAVAGGLAVTQEQDGDHECVAAYDLASGRPHWRHRDPARYDTKVGGTGPRATPAIDGGRVYTMGATGLLNCLELATGKRIWSAATLQDGGAAVPDWGCAGSPWIEGDLVIVQSGDRLAAYDRSAGKPRWFISGEAGSYSSPAVRVIGGLRQIVMLNRGSCTGHALSDGARLWRHEWRGEQPKVAQPLLLGGDRLLISAGYGVGADVFRVSGGRTEPLWSSPRLKAKFSNLVLQEGHVYGFDDGRLVCLRAADGERAWSGPRLGHGQLLLAGGSLLITSENGDLLLADAGPAAFRERARLPVFDHKLWNSPALAGAFLLLRTDREAVCLELPLR